MVGFLKRWNTISLNLWFQCSMLSSNSFEYIYFTSVVNKFCDPTFPVSLQFSGCFNIYVFFLLGTNRPPPKKKMALGGKGGLQITTLGNSPLNSQQIHIVENGGASSSNETNLVSHKVWQAFESSQRIIKPNDLPMISLNSIHLDKMTQSRSWKWRYHWLKLKRHGLENILKSISPRGRFKNCKPFQAVRPLLVGSFNHASTIDVFIKTQKRCETNHRLISKFLLRFIKTAPFLLHFPTVLFEKFASFPTAQMPELWGFFFGNPHAKLQKNHEICRLLQFTLPKTHIHVWNGTFRSSMGDSWCPCHFFGVVRNSFRCFSSRIPLRLDNFRV